MALRIGDQDGRWARPGEGVTTPGPVRTTCPYCGVGCGVQVASGGTVSGDPDHPANRGRLCSKGAALGETLGSAGRLLQPQIGGQAASWDEALDLIAERFAPAIAASGPDAVAFYISGQFLTEDYYVANKLMKGFIGSGNVDTNSRLCMASSVSGHVRAFGDDIVPGCFDDIESARLVVLVGSNMAWCHPVLYQRLAAAKAARGTRVVIIDPRRTATCDIADLHLTLRPGTDVCGVCRAAAAPRRQPAVRRCLGRTSRHRLCRGGRGGAAFGADIDADRGHRRSAAGRPRPVL